MTRSKQDDKLMSGEAQSPPGRSRLRPVSLILALCVGVPVGFGLGQMGRNFHANQANEQPEGNETSGRCKAWADTICARMGSELAYECTHARAASRLLPGAACVQAQEGILAKIDELKAERVHCDELFSKVCSDLGPETKGCELAMAKAPTLSSEDCQGMKRRYKRTLDKITTIVKRREEEALSMPPHEPNEDVAIATPN